MLENLRGRSQLQTAFATIIFSGLCLLLSSVLYTGGPRIVLMLGQTETALFEKPH